MFTLPQQEPERSGHADAYAEVGRALLTGLAHAGTVWCPVPVAYLPPTRSPKGSVAAPPDAPVTVTPRRPTGLRSLFRRFAG